MSPTQTRHLAIIGLATLYENLTHRHSTFYFLLRRKAKHAETDIYQRCAAIYDYCLLHRIPPAEFIRAQFDEWRKPHRAAPSFPTLRYLGTSDAAIARYESAIRKRSPDIEVSGALEQGEATLKSFCRVRSVHDVFRDPIAVRALPVEFVQRHPEFLAAKAEGCYGGDMAKAILSEYLG